MKTKRMRAGKIQLRNGHAKAQHNGNFGRPHEDHLQDLRAITQNYGGKPGDGAKVVAVQELTRKIQSDDVPGYNVVQTDRPGHCGEALLVWHENRVIAHGVEDASADNFGERIGNRGIPWALYERPDGVHELDIAFHNVPLRMQDGPLDEAYAFNLRQVIAHQRGRAGGKFTVLGDMNNLARRDVAGLNARFDAVWLGARIDLQAWSPRRRDLLWWEKPHPNRNDGHPTLYAMSTGTFDLYN